METTKRCCRCREYKPLAEFGKNRRFPDGLYKSCKQCKCEENRRYKSLHPEQYSKRPAVRHIEPVPKYCTLCRQLKPPTEFGRTRYSMDGLRSRCRICNRETDRKQRVCRAKPVTQPFSGLLWALRRILSQKRAIIRRQDANERKRLAKKKPVVQPMSGLIWCLNQIRQQKRRKEETVHHNVWRLHRDRIRMKTDIKYRIARLMSRGVRGALRKSSKHGISWIAFMPYTVDQLRHHLAKTMPIGYRWDDFLSGKLHIDHINPISVHNFQSVDDPDFLRCWSLKNLRLLPAAENRHKHTTLPRGEFQPSLILAKSG